MGSPHSSGDRTGSTGLSGRQLGNQVVWCKWKKKWGLICCNSLWFQACVFKIMYLLAVMFVPVAGPMHVVFMCIALAI